MLVSGVLGSTRPERVLSLDLRLRAIGDEVSASSIDELWVFPPLPDRDTACEFLVLICYDGEDRRRVLTAHVDAQRSDPESDEFEWVQRLREHGAVPEGWVSAIPDRLLKRLAEAGIPEIIEVAGSAEAWDAAIARFAEASANGSPVSGVGREAGGARIDSGENGRVVSEAASPSTSSNGTQVS